MTDDTNRLGFSAAEMAERFGKSTKTWTRWVKEGKAPKPVMQGNKAYWPASVIDTWWKRKIKER